MKIIQTWRDDFFHLVYDQCVHMETTDEDYHVVSKFIEKLLADYRPEVLDEVEAELLRKMPYEAKHIVVNVIAEMKEGK